MIFDMGLDEVARRAAPVSPIYGILVVAIVAVFIAMLKVALIVVFTATFVAP